MHEFVWWLDWVALPLGYLVVAFLFVAVLLGIGVLYVWVLHRLLRWWRV